MDHGLSVIPSQDRVPWYSIMAMWMGTMVCVSSVMIGGVLMEGLPFYQAIAAGIIGYTLLLAIALLQGMQCCDLGVPTVVAAEPSLGKNGVRCIFAVIIAVSLMGWFGVQTNLCVNAFEHLVRSAFGVTLPPALSAVVFGLAMTTTAVYGFKAMEWLHWFAVPLLLIIVCFGVYKVIVLYGVDFVTGFSPQKSFSLSQGVAVTLGGFIVGVVISGDFARYNRSRRDVVKSCVLGIFPIGVVLIVTGAVLSVTVNTYDISLALDALGMPIIGMVALILASWTTNSTNAYFGGLALTHTCQWDARKRPWAAALIGLSGTVLAVLNILDHFIEFLTLLSKTIPPVAGVMMSDYWLARRGASYMKCKPVMGLGMVAWLMGIVMAMTTPADYAPVIGIVTACVVYLAGYRVRLSRPGCEVQ